MGMLPSYIKLVGSMHTRYRFEGPVCSLGNQDVWATKDDIVECLKEVGHVCKPSLHAIPHSSRTFEMNAELSQVAREFVHARTFFEALGIEEYLDMDKFDSDRPALLHDLNDPVPGELHERFGLVFDGGTIEHIFDVKQVLSNVVAMLRPNGCVVHLCSFALDHGFYAFSPVMYFDFYAANGFGDFECHLMELDLGDVTRTYKARHRCIKYEYGMQLDGVLDPTKELLIFFSARKKEGIAAVRVPTQGAYALRGHLADTAEVAQASAFDRLVPPALQPVLGPAKPLLRAAYRTYRRFQLRRTVTVQYI